ncbi:terpenoid synthase [Tricholoma matsutake]|nr:terpenoid synthase [Tricholoma matsutake 945]
MPDALDDRIELAVLLLDVLFLTDDIMDHWSHDQAKVFCSHFQGLVLGTSAPSAESQVEVVIASLYKRFRDTEVTESNSYHLITDFCNYTCTWFSTLTRTGRANDIHELESYLEYRFFDSGASLTMAMVRWTSNFSVPAYMRKDPSVKLVEVTAGCQAALVNDICSYRREVSIMSQKGAGEISKNIVNAVVLIMKEMNLDEKEAIKYLWEYVSQLEERFLDAVEKAKARYSGVDLETLEKYANALELMCGGNLTWSTFCGRYNHFA